MQRRNVSSSKTEIPDGGANRPSNGKKTKKRRCSFVGWMILLTGMCILAAVIWQFISLFTVVNRRENFETSSSWVDHRRMNPEELAKLMPEKFPKPWNIEAAPYVIPKADVRCEKQKLSRAMLDKSLALGTRFLLVHQKQAGNFDYEYDWTTNEKVDDDMEVRQAGALWGMSLIFHDMMDTLPSKEDMEDPVDLMAVLKVLSVHLLRGFEFFVMQNSMVLEQGGITMRYITYPNSDNKHGIGTVGLISLALVEFLRATANMPDFLEDRIVSNYKRQKLESYLRELMAFLVTSHTSVGSPNFNSAYRFTTWSRMISAAEWKSWGLQESPYRTITEGPDGGYGGYFYPSYNDEGVSFGKSSSYYDGECLLAIIKAAKYLDYNFLYPMAVGTAQSLYKRHVTEALKEDEDSAETKGFYQWSSMCFYELATTTVDTKGDYYDPKQFGKWLIELALWMIDVHGTLNRAKNTGYAYEGIVPAYAYAVSSSSSASGSTSEHLQCTIEEGLSKLISWQVGMGEVEKNAEDWDGSRGLGGVQNSKKETGLRIDTTQHQMHATILTRRLVYNKEKEISWPWDTETLIPKS